MIASGDWIWVWIAVAGAAGAVARFVVDGIVLTRTGGRLPWGTALINLTGAFVLGVIAGAAPAHAVMLIVGTGFLGAYTTFSTLMFETYRLAEGRELGAAALNILGSCTGGLIAVYLGIVLGRAL